MTREQFKQNQMAALNQLRLDVEAYQRDPKLKANMRSELEQGYQAILQKQAQWERGEFWTEENEKKYRETYQKLH